MYVTFAIYINLYVTDFVFAKNFSQKLYDLITITTIHFSNLSLNNSTGVRSYYGNTLLFSFDKPLSVKPGFQVLSSQMKICSLFKLSLHRLFRNNTELFGENYSLRRAKEIIQ